MPDNNEKNNISYPNCCIMADGVRVLCVDDEPGLPERVRTFLEESGEFTVDTVRSAPAALALLKNKNYDAIVSGYLMPDMDGIGLLKSVRTSDTAIPFILFTGRGSEEVAIDAINNGADFYLRKGSEPKARFAELEQRIRQAVRERKTRIKKEQDLRESEEKYRQLTEATDDIIYMTDLQGTFSHVSPQVSRYGYTQEEVISHNFTEFLAESDVPEVLAGFREAVSTRTRKVTAIRVRDKAGNLHWVEDNGTPVVDASGSVVALSGILRDITGRMEAEKAQKESEMMFRTLVELSLEGIFIVDFSGNLLFANRAAGVIVDAPDYEAMIGKKNVMDFVDKESQAAVLRDFGKVFLGIDAYLVHYKLVTAMKREVWVELIGKKIPFRDSSAILISMRDVTERKLAEVSLRESEHKFATVFRSSPVALTLVSATDGTFVDVNDSYVRNTGYSRDEVIGRTAEELGLFADKNEYEHYVSALQKHRIAKGIEQKCRVKSGEVRTCSFSSAIIQMGKKPRILSSIEDITERKSAEIALKESEGKYRSLVETSPDIIWEIDPQGIFRYVSPQIQAVMGYTPEKLIGRSVIDLVPEKLKPLMVQELGRLSSEGDLSPFEVPARHHDGHTMVLEIRPSLTGTNGKRGGFRGMAVDITERRRDEDALRQANKKLNLLSGITRHDIMNKLMALDGFVALLHNKIPDPSDNPYFSRITAASSQIANLIQFTKEYEKVGVHAPAWQDMRALVDAAGRDNAPGKVTLKNDLPAGTEVFADPLIAKVFFNLIDNAVRHGGTITTIRFSSEERDGARVIVCADDGDGVPADEKERIFERGFGKNTGFGLALSREILDITGITIKETGEAGTGARFEIAVPKNQYRPLP
jgi:PAS domain S-box-containing protein